jgi:hypothetical protein
MSIQIIGPGSSRRVGGGGYALDIPAVNAFFQAPLGPVGLMISSRGDRVLAAARRDVGVGKPDPLDREGARTPGTLRDSLRLEPMPGLKGPAVRVGSADPIAFLHHQGTRAHTIFPRRSGGSLHFWSDSAGAEVFARKVNHPGTKPRPYLTKNLPLAIV